MIDKHREDAQVAQRLAAIRFQHADRLTQFNDLKLLDGTQQRNMLTAIDYLLALVDTAQPVRLTRENGSFIPEVYEQILIASPCGVAGHFKFQLNGGNCMMCDEVARARAHGAEAERCSVWDEAIAVVSETDRDAVFADDECLRGSLISALEAARDRNAL